MRNTLRVFVWFFLVVFSSPGFGIAGTTIQPKIRPPVHVGVSAVFVESVQVGSKLVLRSIDENGVRNEIASEPNAKGRTRFGSLPSIDPGWKLQACASRGNDPYVCSEPVPVQIRPTRLMDALEYSAGTLFYYGSGCVGVNGHGLISGSQVALIDKSDPSDPDPYKYSVEVNPYIYTSLMLETGFWPRTQFDLKIVGQLDNQAYTRETTVPPARKYEYVKGCERKVLPPAFEVPPEACRKGLHLEELAPGGYFKAYQGATTIFGPNCATETRQYLSLGNWIEPNVTLSTDQELNALPSCSKTSQEVGEPHLPEFTIEPVKVGSKAIMVNNLVQGAVLEVKIFDTEGAVRTYADIPVDHPSQEVLLGDEDRIRDGDKEVQVTETIRNSGLAACELSSQEKVNVDPSPGPLQQLEIVEPIYECTTRIKVNNHQKGAEIVVKAQGQILTTTQQSDVEIARDRRSPLHAYYPLEAGWDLTAVQEFDGRASHPSKAVRVKPLPNIDRPLEIFGMGVRDLIHESGGLVIDICNPAVFVSNGVPGALVDIYRTGQVPPTGAPKSTFQLLAQGRIDENGTAIIDLPPSIALGDIIRAKQSLCGEASEDFSNPLRVVHTVAISDTTLQKLQSLDKSESPQYVPFHVELGCPASEDITMKTTLNNTNVLKIALPKNGELTINQGANEGKIAIALLKHGKSTLNIVGRYVTSKPATADLETPELVRVHVFDWVDQAPVFIKKWIENSNETSYFIGEVDPAEVNLGPIGVTKVKTISNYSFNLCGFRVLDELGPPDNRCLAPIPIINYLATEASGLPYSFNLDTIPTSQLSDKRRYVDRKWYVCKEGGVCLKDEVEMELKYQTFTD